MKCRRHPRYEAKKPPRSRCFDCWSLWLDRDDAPLFHRGIKRPKGATVEWGDPKATDQPPSRWQDCGLDESIDVSDYGREQSLS